MQSPLTARKPLRNPVKRTRRLPGLHGRHCWGLAAMLAFCSLPGCFPDAKVGFDSPAPSKRIDAIVQASALKDDPSLAKLVEKLGSRAPAERMLAIRSLEIRTGTTLGYEHAAPQWKRIEARARWIEYLRARGIEPPTVKDDGRQDENQPIEQDAGEI